MRVISGNFELLPGWRRGAAAGHSADAASLSPASAYGRQDGTGVGSAGEWFSLPTELAQAFSSDAIIRRPAASAALITSSSAPASCSALSRSSRSASRSARARCRFVSRSWSSHARKRSARRARYSRSTLTSCGSKPFPRIRASSVSHRARSSPNVLCSPASSSASVVVAFGQRAGVGMGVDKGVLIIGVDGGFVHGLPLQSCLLRALPSSLPVTAPFAQPLGRPTIMGPWRKKATARIRGPWMSELSGSS